MQFSSPLCRGTLVKRYKRFLADVILENGEEITAHIANSGSMLGLNEAGMEVWLSKSDNPKRKLKYSWELVRDGDGAGGDQHHASQQAGRRSNRSRQYPGTGRLWRIAA